MRRVWCNYRELELSLGASISVHRPSCYDAERQDTLSVLGTSTSSPSRLSLCCTGKTRRREPAGFLLINTFSVPVDRTRLEPSPLHRRPRLLESEHRE